MFQKDRPTESTPPELAHIKARQMESVHAVESYQELPGPRHTHPSSLEPWNHLKVMEWRAGLSPSGWSWWTLGTICGQLQGPDMGSRRRSEHSVAGEMESGARKYSRHGFNQVLTGTDHAAASALGQSSAVSPAHSGGRSPGIRRTL